MATKAKASADGHNASVNIRNAPQASIASIASIASPAMTLKEASLFLRCGIGHVRRLCHGGKLSWQMSGKHWIVLRSEVETLLDRGWHRAGDK